MSRNESFGSLARMMYSGMRSTLPISPSIFSAASLAPPCAGPHRQAMPAAIQANGLAPVDPASRTVEVEAFCSWSACRVKMRSIARDSTGLTLYSSQGTETHAQEVRRIVELVVRIYEWLADRIFVGHGRERRHFRNHANGRDHALGRISDVGGVVIERRK